MPGTRFRFRVQAPFFRLVDLVEPGRRMGSIGVEHALVQSQGENQRSQKGNRGMKAGKTEIVRFCKHAFKSEPRALRLLDIANALCSDEMGTEAISRPVEQRIPGVR